MTSTPDRARSSDFHNLESLAATNSDRAAVIARVDGPLKVLAGHDLDQEKLDSTASEEWEKSVWELAHLERGFGYRRKQINHVIDSMEPMLGFNCGAAPNALKYDVHFYGMRAVMILPGPRPQTVLYVDRVIEKGLYRQSDQFKLLGLIEEARG